VRGVHAVTDPVDGPSASVGFRDVIRIADLLFFLCGFKCLHDTHKQVTGALVPVDTLGCIQLEHQYQL
jgi:hypothetical protein